MATINPAAINNGSELRSNINAFVCQHPNCIVSIEMHERVAAGVHVHTLTQNMCVCGISNSNPKPLTLANKESPTKPRLIGKKPREYDADAAGNLKRAPDDGNNRSIQRCQVTGLIGPNSPIPYFSHPCQKKIFLIKKTKEKRSGQRSATWRISWWTVRESSAPSGRQQTHRSEESR